MGFVAWFYIARIGGTVLFLLFFASLVWAKEGSVLAEVGGWALNAFVLLCLAGAGVAILVLLTPFRFACPRCKRRCTRVSGSKREGIWLRCADCGVAVGASGFWPMRLRYVDKDTWRRPRAEERRN